MKRLFLAILLSCSVFLSAQDVRLVVQTGHSASITDVTFSPLDEFIASASSDHKIIIWDFLTGKQFNVLLGHTAKITSISFHPENEYLITSSLDSTVKIWNYLTAEIIREIQFDYPVHAVSYNAIGDEFLSIGKELRVHDNYANTYSLLPIRPKYYFNTLCMSHDDNYILVGGEDEPLAYLFNCKTQKVVKRFTFSIISGFFNESKNTVLFSTSNGLSFSYNFFTGKKKSKSTDWMLNTVNDIVCDTNSIYLADDYGNIRILEQEKWFQTNVLKGHSTKINAMALSNDGRYLAAGGESQSVVVWDIHNLRVNNVLKGLVNRINDIAFSEDGQEILVVYEDGSLRKTNLITNQTIVNKMVVDSDILNRIGYYSVLTIKSFTPEQAILEVLYKQSHLNIEGVYDRLKEVDLKWVFSSNSILTEDRSGLSGLNKIYISDLKKGKYHDNTFFQSELSKRDLNETLGIEAILLKDKLLLKNIGDSIPFRTIFTQHSDLVSCVEFNQKFGFVATASWDGMIRFWNINNGELLTVFGAFGDGQFVYIHPEGYYFASKNALRYIGFSLNNKMFSFDQFDLKYNRPDRVISTLPYYEEFYHQAFFRAYKKRLEKLGVQGSDFDVTTDIPILEVLNDLDSSLDQHKLTLSLSCIEKKDSLDRLHLFVNGVPEYGKYGKKINGKVFQDEVSLILNPGANLIQLYVTNTRNNSSLKKSLRVQAPPEKENSRLFILSIGVSNYEQNHYNLSYAAKDAKDVGTMFSTLSRYQLEKSKILMDSVVTKKNVIAMKNFFSEAKENDIVVLFVAGHGVLDDKLDYFFAPYEMDFKRPSKSGIAFGLFEDILENTKSRKKIMFLDACHSGEIDKDEVVKKFVSEDEESGEGLTFRRVGRTIRNIDEINSFELSRALFADMRLNNGATVISSAGGAEYAIEGEEWQNGVFTYVLLDGLLNKNADKNNDKRVTISELQLYIQNGVHSLTRGRQTPTSRVENLNYDFIIARKWND